MKLAARLLLIIVLAALPVLALQVYEHSQEREARKTQIADQAFQMARQAAAEQDQFIEGARYLLAAASQLREVQERDGPACSARMTELRRQVPNVAGLGVVDPDGVRFCGSEPDAQRIDVSDRPYFRAALQDKRLAISGFIIGRRSGKPHLNFAYPAVDDAGEVRAVLILAFGLEQLSGQLAASPLPPGAMISLVDSAGRLLARAPPAPERIGEWVRDDSFSKLMLTLRAGVVEGTGVDGVERVYGFAPLFASADLFAVVGLPLRDTYAAADRLFWREVAVTALAFLAAAVLAWIGAELWIRRPVAALQRVVGRMQTGDLGARTKRSRYSTPELSSLAGSFDAMAEALQSRQTELQASEERLRAVVETAADGIVMANQRGVIEFVNPAALRMFGYRREELLGQNLKILMPPPDRDKHDEYIERYLRTGEARIIGIGREVVGQRKNGETFPTSLSIGEFREGDERFFTGIVRDITERKRSEEHQRLLMAEIDHRAKNMLAAVQSMVVLSKQNARSIEDYSRRLIGRFRAMARGHDLLARERWEGVRLHDLIRGELHAFVDPDSRAVAIGGEDVVLPPRVAQTLTLVVHELGTNAAKHGALSVPSGQVRIGSAVLREANGARLHLQWVETGVPDVRAPLSRGFGSNLIERGIAHELDGSARTEFTREGMRCEIEIPLGDAGARMPAIPAGAFASPPCAPASRKRRDRR